jgi:hypothetical protein
VLDKVDIVGYDFREIYFKWLSVLDITGLIPIKLGIWMPNIVGLILAGTFLGLNGEQ